MYSCASCQKHLCGEHFHQHLNSCRSKSEHNSSFNLALFSTTSHLVQARNNVHNSYAPASNYSICPAISQQIYCSGCEKLGSSKCLFCDTLFCDSHLDDHMCVELERDYVAAADAHGFSINAEIRPNQLIFTGKAPNGRYKKPSDDLTCLLMAAAYADVPSWIMLDNVYQITFNGTNPTTNAASVFVQPWPLSVSQFTRTFLLSSSSYLTAPQFFNSLHRLIMSSPTLVQNLYEPHDRLWNNMVEKQTFLTDSHGDTESIHDLKRMECSKCWKLFTKVCGGFIFMFPDPSIPGGLRSQRVRCHRKLCADHIWDNGYWSEHSSKYQCLKCERDDQLQGTYVDVKETIEPVAKRTRTVDPEFPADLWTPCENVNCHKDKCIPRYGFRTSPTCPNCG